MFIVLTFGDWMTLAVNVFVRFWNGIWLWNFVQAHHNWYRHLNAEKWPKTIIAQVNSIWRFQHTHTHKKWKGIVSILSIIFFPISEFIPLMNAEWQQIFIWLEAYSIQHFAICYVIGNVYDDRGCSAFLFFVSFRFSLGFSSRYFVF